MHLRDDIDGRHGHAEALSEELERCSTLGQLPRRLLHVAGIVQGLTALEAAGVPPRLLIIDDGWQLTLADQDDRTDAAPQLQTVAPAEPKPAESTADEQ